MTSELGKTPVERLIDDIRDKRSKWLQERIYTPQKQPYLYLSGIHSCARNLFYRMTEGDKRQPFDEELTAKLEAGNDQERLVKRHLLDLGFELIKAQERIEIPYAGAVKELRGQIMAVGKIDGVFKYEGCEIPAEQKAMSNFVYDRIESVDDLLKMEYTERYVRQLLLYLYGKSLDFGLFILTDFMGHLKFIPIYLHNHLEVAEYALKTMEKSWEAKASGVIPDRIAFHSKICGKCDFQAICLPEVTVGGDAQVIDDPELEASIEVHESLKEKKDAYEDLHDSLLARLKAFSQSTVGKFIVKTKQRVRVSYDSKQLTDEQRAAIKKETTYTVMDIERIG